MKRCTAFILGALLALILTGCAQEEASKSLTAVSLDTYAGTVTGRFTRGDGETYTDYLEVDTGEEAPLLFALPGAAPGVGEEADIGDRVRIENLNPGDAHPVWSVTVTEPSPVLKAPPPLTVSAGEESSAEARLGTWSWYYREGHAIESDAVSPLLWEDMQPLVLSPAALSHTAPLRLDLRFGNLPDEAEVKYWSGDCRGQSGAESTELPTAYDEEAGCFYIELPDVNCIYEVTARWDQRPEGYGGTAHYAFCTELPAYIP